MKIKALKVCMIICLAALFIRECTARRGSDGWFKNKC